MDNQQPSGNIQWKTVQEYENYEVNQLGEIRHKSRRRVLKPRVSPNGYLYVNFNIAGRRTNFAVHRIVLNAFTPHEDKSLEVNHKNYDRTDNRLENLEWVSSSENKKHANKKVQNRHSRGKEIHQYSKTGEYIKTFPSVTDAAKSIGLGVAALSNCALGRTKSSGGFVWKFAEGSTTKYNRNPGLSAQDSSKEDDDIV